MPKNWCSEVKNILEKITGDNSHFSNKMVVNIKECAETLDVLDGVIWEAEVEKRDKLRTYRIFKTHNKTEKYVTRFLSKGSRAILAQFRCGISPLKLKLDSSITYLWSSGYANFAQKIQLKMKNTFCCTVPNSTRKDLFCFISPSLNAQTF